MKLAFHGRIALWNSLLIALAFVVFGFRRATVLFALLALLSLVVFVLRLRSEVSRPLSDLSTAVRQATSGGPIRLPIRRGKGEIEQLAAELADWSQKSETRIEELSDARRRLESILSAMGEGVLVFDKDHRIVLANEALVTLLNLRTSPLGKTCLEIMRDESLDQSLEIVFSGEPTRAVEFQTSTAVAVRALLSPMQNESGTRVDAVVCVFHDVSNSLRIDRVRRDFVANVSHEFKTPLTSIRGYAETMLAEDLPPGKKDFIDIIYRNARYLESLVNDLLELARLESESPSSWEQVDLGSLVNEQIMLRRRPKEPALEIEVDCPSIEVQADPARLSKALSNLIDNAIAYNRPEGKIRVSARWEGESVVIDVSDSGFGIPDEERERIFERFYRVDKARARRAGGTGLGLAIARHAVESQGGTLTVRSQVGVGSTFTIRLPAAWSFSKAMANDEADQ
jgi:two-component system phosphate regulon sensor histidine kinase PhoR